MAIIYIIAALIVIFAHINVVVVIGGIRHDIQGAFSAKSRSGRRLRITIMKTMQKGIGRVVFSNEAGWAPAHAAHPRDQPCEAGFTEYSKFSWDTIVICSLHGAGALLRRRSGVQVDWGNSRHRFLIAAAFSTVFGNKIGALIVAVGITLFALSTVLAGRCTAPVTL